MIDPRRIPEGLYIVETPALPDGYQIRCVGCGCSVDIEHVPMSELCSLAREDRDRAIRS